MVNTNKYHLLFAEKSGNTGEYRIIYLKKITIYGIIIDGRAKKKESEFYFKTENKALR